jgi:Tol biopolymer transport system component/predicted Ser/Thr protein kinase
MTHWTRLKELYQQAEERPLPERAAFLEAACGGDTGLLREVESLLAAGDSAGSFLESAPEMLWEARALAMAGVMLGHYRLDELLGSGGMGLVYRATDTRLGRTVAIKLLRPEMAATADAQRRFQREAKAASALKHPNIVTIYDAGQSEGRDFLVMEFVEGQTVAERLRGGPMPFADALACGIQVAAALEAAHAAGILHRDLKPQNVMMDSTGSTKVVDFGLAKVSARGEPAQSQMTETRLGAVMGTAAYMSPEQAEGQPVDARSDLFSFGALLYEMLSGRRAFKGASPASTLAAVLRDEPAPLDPAPWNVIARCLEKDPGRRFQTPAELGAALEAVRAGGPVRRRKWARPAAAVLVLAGVLGAAVWLAGRVRPFRPTQPAISLSELTADSGLTTEPALSPGGHLLAYASDRDNGNHLDIWVQPVEGGPARRLTSGAADRHEPAFSPDGRQICYRSEQDGGGIWTVPVSGGEPKLLMRGGRRPRYSPDGKWIASWTGLPGIGDPAAPGSGRMFLVPAAGGEPQPLRPDFRAARYPLWSSDGKHILFAGTATNDLASYDWWVTDLSGGAAVRTGARRALAQGWLTPVNSAELPEPAVWRADTGTILFTSRNLFPNLWEVPISPLNWKVSSRVVRVTVGNGNEDHPAVSAGRMVFAGLTARSNLWSIENGELKPITQTPWFRLMPSFSSQGDVLAFLQPGGIAVRDQGSGTERLLSGTAGSPWGRMSPDGRQVFYVLNVQGQAAFYTAGLSDGNTARQIGWLDSNERVWDVSADGASVLSMGLTAPRGVLWRDLRTGRRVLFLSHPEWNLYWASFSPDGKWVAFTARTGPEQSRAFVAPFHGAAGQSPDVSSWVQITEGMANDTAPRWSPDGRRLYYFSDRDGYRCIWSVGFEQGHPSAPAAVWHFHENRRSLGNAPVSMTELAISQHRIVFNLTELSGNIYLVR